MIQVTYNPRLAIRADSTDPVELWLVRLRPGARSRYLSLLYTFLDHCGYGPITVSAAVQAAERDTFATHETLKAFIASLPDSREERVFAYAGIRSFYSRCRIYLPSDPYYDVGGQEERWWLTQPQYNQTQKSPYQGG